MLDKIMNDRINELRGLKVVMFGAGRNARRQIGKLMENGITPAYFVDNCPKTDAFVYFNEKTEEFVHIPICAPDALLKEDKENLKILITPDTPLYEKIEEQVKDMGFGPCVATLNVRCCHNLAMPALRLFRKAILFCCTATNDCNNTRPEFPYLETVEENIGNYFQKRASIIEELNKYREINIAKPCIGCGDIGSYYVYDETIRLFDISACMIAPPCNAKCIYCIVYNEPQNTDETARNTKNAVDLFQYVKNMNLLGNGCGITFASGEITTIPEKELILDTLSGYKITFLTNAFLFEPKIAHSLKFNGSTIMVDMDSGTRETFKLVKGRDKFFDVLINLKRYRENGRIRMKYNILAGVNDNDADIDGIINILQALDIWQIELSFDFFMPLRTAFLSIVKFITKLKNRGMQYRFSSHYTPIQIEALIKHYYAGNYIAYLKQKNHDIHNIFKREYLDDYNDYREYIYTYELKELVQHFKKGTRVALLGHVSGQSNTISAFKELGIPLQTPDLGYKESYDKIKDSTDIFIINDRSKYNDIKAYIEANGGNGNRLLNIGNYYFSFEPAEVFMKNNIIGDYYA